MQSFKKQSEPEVVAPPPLEPEDDAESKSSSTGSVSTGTSKPPPIVTKAPSLTGGLHQPSPTSGPTPTTPSHAPPSPTHPPSPSSVSLSEWPSSPPASAALPAFSEPLPVFGDMAAKENTAGAGNTAAMDEELPLLDKMEADETVLLPPDLQRVMPLQQRHGYHGDATAFMVEQGSANKAFSFRAYTHEEAVADAQVLLTAERLHIKGRIKLKDLSAYLKQCKVREGGAACHSLVSAAYLGSLVRLLWYVHPDEPALPVPEVHCHRLDPRGARGRPQQLQGIRPSPHAPSQPRPSQTHSRMPHTPLVWQSFSKALESAERAAYLLVQESADETVQVYLVPQAMADSLDLIT